MYDFREYLEKLEEAGELAHVRSEVDPNLEISAISQRISERGGPAVHFWNVAGAGRDVTYVGASMSRGVKGIWSKLAIALDLDPTSRYEDILENAHRRWESPIRPIQVTEGPCKENILKGDEVDLKQLAAPVLHEGDGGAYLTSWAVTISQEPDSGFVAWDVIPLMVTSANTLSGHLGKDSNLARIYDKYAAADQPMPFAIVLGGPPLVPVAAAFRLRRTDSVAPEIAGALQRQPLQMVKCETSELLVPATAEMVIEGIIKPGENAESGPFAGTLGYRHPGKVSGPEFKVSTISHRTKPIIPICTWGTPTTEIHISRGLDSDIRLKAEFEKRGAPVTGIFSPPWLAGSTVAVKTIMPYPAYSLSIAGIVRVSEPSKNVPYVLVCNDDLDLTNPVSLFHALVTKCHPKRDVVVIKNSSASADAPYLSASERELGSGATAIFDCTWPLDWDKSIAVPPKVCFAESYPVELQEKILAEWSNGLGFPNEDDRPA